MSLIQYDSYVDFLKNILVSSDLSQFKSNSNYNEILEHVSEQQGYQYLFLIKNNTNISLDEIITFCKLNDAIGSPHMTDFGDFKASPTSLRYIWHTHVILSYFQKFREEVYNIVEIGGGYGGLCLALHFFSHKYNITIGDYNILDLKEATELQKLYLDTLQVPFKVTCMTSDTFGKDIQTTNNYLISNYCFSEIHHSLQKQYIQNLFSKVKHGFLAWNMIPVYNFGFPLEVEEETPKTGSMNKFVYF